MNSHQLGQYFVALKLLTRYNSATPFCGVAIDQEYNLTDRKPSISDTRKLVTQPLIQESSKAELAARVARHHQNVTYTLRAPRSGSFHPKPPTVEAVQGPIYLWGTRRREECHGPRVCQTPSKSGAIIASGVRDKTYLTLGLSWSSLSDRASMSQS